MALSFVLVSFFILGCVTGERTLHLVNVLYRHGDRSPTGTFPLDKHQEDAWPQGWGQLTKEGMRMQYDLGQFLGERYEGFLSTSYKREEIYIRSTDVDRCLMSAESNLAGLYPPSEDEKFKPNITWQPIPVHTKPVDQDYLLRTDGPPCPYYDQLYQEVLESDQVQAINNENEQFFKDLKKNTGVTYDVTLDTVYKIEDPLFCENAHNMSLPDWADENTLLQLENLTNIGMTTQFQTKKLARLKGGPLVGKMVKDMEDTSANITDIPIKFYMYSAHDTTLAAFMSALGVYNGKQSPYASAVGVELWREDQGQFVVSMWFRNATEQTVPFNLTLQKCPNLCPLNEFKQLLQDVIPIDAAAECGADYKKNYTITIIIGTTIIALILLLIFLYIICRKRSTEHKDGHVRLPNESDPEA